MEKSEKNMEKSKHVSGCFPAILLSQQLPQRQEMKNAYLIQMRRKEEKMMRAREDEAREAGRSLFDGRKMGD